MCVCVHAYFKVSVTAIKGTTSILECSVKMTGRGRKWKGVCVCVLEGGGSLEYFEHRTALVRAVNNLSKTRT